MPRASIERSPSPLGMPSWVIESVIAIASATPFPDEGRLSSVRSFLAPRAARARANHLRRRRSGAAGTDGIAPVHDGLGNPVNMHGAPCRFRLGDDPAISDDPARRRAETD